MTIKFNNIENADIFTRDFSPFVQNNTITFSANEGIAVVYGPNGTGKTSLIKALGDDAGTHVDFELDGEHYTSGNNVFHIINDQNNRNIIQGETQDFFLGDNIRREFELQGLIAQDRTNLISGIIALLKSDFSIASASSQLINILPADLIDFVKDCANSRSKGSRYTDEQIIALFSRLARENIPTVNEEKLAFVKKDLSEKKSIIKMLQQLSEAGVDSNAHIHEIEENTEAIRILARFQKDQCIVCDNENIDREALLAAKEENRDATISSLSANVKEAVEKVLPLVTEDDPFQIKPLLLDAIAIGDVSQLRTLIDEVAAYQSFYSSMLKNALIELFYRSELSSHYQEYVEIIEGRPEINSEDYLYIREIISSSMSKTLSVDREGGKLKLTLGHKEFLGTPRDQLPLSAGEQNFLSLTFEFLKAKNSACPVVVIDDPISSFDSIYKNKVVYAIVRMLHDKKRIVLTHNTDLIRLLEAQFKNCFDLFLLNNVDGEQNGFIPFRRKEKDMLISLESLITALSEDVPNNVEKPELFLISMIPFMRGYASIVRNAEVVENLTQVMHGYKTQRVDIANAYTQLFGRVSDSIPTSYEVSVEDILEKTVDGVHILNTDEYPVLDKTLRHTFTYLFMRLIVEKRLVEHFGLDTNRYKQLGQIIAAAFPNQNDLEQMRKRVRLTSKKTLINEFNHFDGNLSIFQPAIDITDKALGEEKTAILTFIDNI